MSRVQDEFKRVARLQQVARENHERALESGTAEDVLMTWHIVQNNDRAYQELVEMYGSPAEVRQRERQIRAEDKARREQLAEMGRVRAEVEAGTRQRRGAAAPAAQEEEPGGCGLVALLGLAGALSAAVAGGVVFFG